jgi:hypothetical protein
MNEFKAAAAADCVSGEANLLMPESNWGQGQDLVLLIGAIVSQGDLVLGRFWF